MFRGHIRARTLFLAIIVIWLLVWLWLPNVPRQRAFAPGAHTEVLPVEVELKRQIEAVTTVEHEVEPEFLPVDHNTISGTVSDQDGAPIPNAEVAAYHPDRGDMKSTSGAQGHFTIGELETDKTYRVSAKAARFNEAFIRDVPPGTQDITLVLEPLSSAHGTVVELGSRSPISDFEVAHVVLPPDNKADWQSYSVDPSIKWVRVANADGAFVLSDIPSKRSIAIAARAKGYSPAFAPCDAIAPGETAHDIIIALETGASIAGTIETSEGARVSGATIYLGMTDDALIEQTKSASDGAFEIDGIMAAHWIVVGKHSEYALTREEISTTRNQRANVRLVFPAVGVLEGIVTNNGAPVSGGKIFVSLHYTAERLALNRQTETNAAGKFSISGLVAGQYDVGAHLPNEIADGHSQRMDAVAEIEPGKITFVALAFRPATASITVRVTMNGAPVTGCEVRGVIGTDGGDKNFNATADTDGVFRSERLPPGAAYVEVIANQAGGPLKRALTFTLRDGANAEHTVDFDAQIGITGKITTLTDGEHAEVIVVAGKADADLNNAEELLAVRHMASGVAEVNEDGTFRVEGLEPGDYTVIAVAFNPDDDAGNPLDTMRLTKEAVTLANETLELDLAP